MFSNFVPSTKCEYDVCLRLCRPRPHAVTAVCCQTSKAPNQQRTAGAKGAAASVRRRRPGSQEFLYRAIASSKYRSTRVRLPVVGWVVNLSIFSFLQCKQCLGWFQIVLFLQKLVHRHV